MQWIYSCVVLVAAYTGVETSALPAIGVESALYQVPGIGQKHLFVKPYPAVTKYQSDLYEVYMQPYAYDLRDISAVAVIVGEGESAIKGELLLMQIHLGPVFIKGNITGLPTGKHGLHIHDAGDLRQGCEKLGGHFNPYLFRHGGPGDVIRHLGDLGNIEANGEGTAEVSLLDPLLTLAGGPRGVVGRALVVSADMDDFGRGGTADSIDNGSSGKALACGVIAYIS